MPNFTFGTFVINQNVNGLGFFLTSRELPLPVVNPVVFNVARRDGAKKSGETVSPRSITANIKVIGSTRTDLVSRIDALQQALALRSQPLCIHEDGRVYQSVDAISAPVKFEVGRGVVSCDVAVAFTAYDPYAYAATSSTYDTGTVALTLASSQWGFPAINIAGGGNTYSFPLIHIINKTSTGSTTLTAGLTSGNVYTSLSVAATTWSASLGDQVTITDAGNTQTLTLSAIVNVGATTLSVSSFTASTNYISGDTVAKVTQWTAISVGQSQDAQTVTANSSTLVPLPATNGDYVDIQCDPAIGWSIQTNGSGKFSDPSGLFPVIEPTTTTFSISISSPSAVSAEAVFSWLPRYVS